MEGIIPTLEEDSKRSSSTDIKIERNVTLESALFGAFKERKVYESMRNSGASKEEMESVVSGMRRMLVEWAHTMWAIACADDIHSPSPHTESHRS